jgi:DNA polymerase-3 subunit epsilon
MELIRRETSSRQDVTSGIGTRMESSVLTERAAYFLEGGPADPVSLISHVCNLPGAPLIVAEHMAQAMFAGRPEFVRDDAGRWLLTSPAPPDYAIGIDMSDVDFDRALALARRPDPDVLSRLSYVVVDVETTGTRHYAGDRITEIAAVVVRDGCVTDVFETLVNPQRSIPPFITQITNITWDMVKDAPTFQAVESELLDLMAGHVFVAHNANFDWRFISSEVRRSSGRELIGRRLCTVKLARRLLPQLPRRSLDHVAEYYGIEISGRHRAGGDAVATAHCLLRLLSDAADRGCLTWSDLDFMIGFRARVRRARRRRSAMPGPVDKDTTA